MYKLKDIKDKVISASDLDIAVVKGTNRVESAPKEKHVKTILHLMGLDAQIRRNVISTLLKRLEESDWIVVLKTLLVFHRVNRSGKMDKYDVEPRAFSNLNRFMDLNTPHTVDQSRIIRSYGAYLEEKVHEKFDDVDFKDLAFESVLKSLPICQQRLASALECVKPLDDTISDTLSLPAPTRLAFVYILRDSLSLYLLESRGILVLLDHLKTLNKDQMESLIEMYGLFVEQTKSLERLWSRFGDEKIELNDAPLQLLPTLQAHLQSFDETEVRMLSLDDGEKLVVGDYSPESSKMPVQASVQEEIEDLWK